MKRICLLILSLSLAIPAFAQSLKFGYFEAPPYVYHEAGSSKLNGAVVEFLEKEIAPAMGITIAWEKKATSIPRQLEQLKTSKLDAAAVFAKNPARAKVYSYPNKPFFKTNPVLAFRKGNTVQQVNSVEDILSYKIGYCAKSFVSPFMRDKRIKWDLVSSSNCTGLNLKKLMAKRFDAQYQPDTPPLLFHARINGVEDNIVLVSIPENVDLYSPFSPNAGPKYVEKYNQAFESVGGADTFLKYLAKYIDINRL